MQDMTKGSILSHLVRYAIPMILGNLLQLTYNAVDAMIIGKFLGENALAAVSTSDPIFTILVLGASGISLGASVMISKFRGAREDEKVRQEFATALVFGFWFSLGVFLLGLALSAQMLRWIQTPQAAMAQAKTYLRVSLVGFLFTFQYNVLASSLRGLGDSKTPVYFLGLSCGLNILLDVLLVAIIPLGVAGAALATVISQAAAAIGCMGYIRRRIPQLSVTKEQLRVNSALLRETLQIGFLTALQQAAQPIGKVCIQGVINTQGIAAIDAFNAGCKIEDFARIPTQSIGSGIMTCTAQNRGAGQRDRMFQSLTKGLLLAFAYFPLIFLLTQLIKGPAIALLLPDGAAEIAAAGVSYIGLKAYFFLMPGITNAIQGHFRGLGMMKVVLFGTVLQTTIRTVCVFFWVPKMGINAEAWACFTGWACMAVVEYSLYFYWKSTGKILK
ncbi:MAG: MATE family efflux transporter [Candidatus Faecousia sp.]|nr:MATE family efflux transporter [Candidatus Faecousia sp.]